jgi:hypothetical protein
MNGKGDKSRNNLSKRFRDNYDQIDWKKKDNPKEKPLSEGAMRALDRPSSYEQLPFEQHW